MCLVREEDSRISECDTNAVVRSESDQPLDNSVMYSSSVDI